MGLREKPYRLLTTKLAIVLPMLKILARTNKLDPTESPMSVFPDRGGIKRPTENQLAVISIGRVSLRAR